MGPLSVVVTINWSSERSQFVKMSNRDSVMFFPVWSSKRLQLPATISEVHCAAEVGMGLPNGPQICRYSEEINFW